MNSSDQTSINDFFKALKIIHLGLIAGLVLFGFIAFYLNQAGNPNENNNEIRNIFIYAVPLLAVGGIYGGNLVFKKKLAELDKNSNLLDKLSTYRSLLIMRYALIEGPTLFSLVAYFLTGDLIFLGIAGLLIAIFLTFKPTREKAINDLQLDPSEREIINNQTLQ